MKIGGGNNTANTNTKNTIVSNKDFYMNATQSSTQRSITVRLHDYMNKMLNPSRQELLAT